MPDIPSLGVRRLGTLSKLTSRQATKTYDQIGIAGMCCEQSRVHSTVARAEQSGKLMKFESKERPLIGDRGTMAVQ